MRTKTGDFAAGERREVMAKIEEAKSGRHMQTALPPEQKDSARAAGKRRLVVPSLKKHGSSNYRNTTLHLATEDSAELVEHFLLHYAPS